METALKEEISVFPDALSQARAAAAKFRDEAHRATAGRGRCSAALSGGTTPRLFFSLLGSEFREQIPWQGVNLFWADERSVPPEHEESNYFLARTEFIAKAPLPAENIHRIRGELPPAQAALLYEEELRNYFGTPGVPVFDLIFLGLGEDGHTASLFPGSEALEEKKHLSLAVAADAAVNWRITLTLPILNNARCIIFLVSGKSKAGIVRALLAEGKRDAYPAGMVKPVRGSVIWLLDREAAAELTPAP